MAINDEKEFYKHNESLMSSKFKKLSKKYKIHCQFSFIKYTNIIKVMETCVKNCGDLVHQEIATKAFMEEMRDLVKQTTDDNIKTKEFITFIKI